MYNHKELIMSLIWIIPLALLIYSIFNLKSKKKAYVKKSTEGLTDNELEIWMKAYEEAKSIGMGMEVDKYLLATSKMDDADKALFLITTKKQIEKATQSTASGNWKRNSPNSYSSRSMFD